MIEDSIKTYLETLTGKSVYLLEKLEGNNDCVVFKQVGLPKSFRTHAGASKHYQARFQIDCYGVTFDDCRGIASTIIADMDGKRTITGIELATLENDFYIKEIDSKLYRNILEFFVWYFE